MSSLIGKLRNRSGGPVSPVPYTARGRYSIPGMAGQTSSENYMATYGTSGTIYAIVSLLASSTAAADWHLYRKHKDGRVRYTTGDQGSDQRTEVVQHQALKVWHSPNPFMTGPEFREAGQQHMELTGEQCWVIAKAGSIPVSMWPVRPDRIDPIPDPDEYLAGWVYTGPSGEKVPLAPDEVIQLKYPNPMDPYRGLGPVQSVLVDIDAAKYSAQWNRSFFLNSATPGGVIQMDKRLSDEEFDEFQNRWREGHRGVGAAHRVAILEQGATWVPNTHSVKDMDFGTLRNVSRDVLREAWGIHKSMLGNADDVNRANAQTAEEVFGRWKVIPRLERLKTALNERFLPMFGATGQGVEFDYVNPLPDDREADNAELTAKAQAFSALVDAGMDPDDVAEVVGLPKMRTKAPAVAPGTVYPQEQPSPGTEPAEQGDGGNPASPETAEKPDTEPDTKATNYQRQIYELRSLLGNAPAAPVNGHGRSR